MENEALYSVKSFIKEENQLRAEIHLNAESEIYKGHFPNNPVTPGVLQIEMIKSVLAAQYQQKFRLFKMNSSKFLAVLNPNTTSVVSVQLTIQEESKEEIKISGTISDADATFMKIQAIFKIQ